MCLLMVYARRLLNAALDSQCSLSQAFAKHLTLFLGSAHEITCTFRGSAMTIEIVIALGVLLTLNLIATVSVARLNVLSRANKLRQLLLVWLIPVLGGSLCLVYAFVVSRDHHEAENTFPPFAESDGCSPNAPGVCETNLSCGGESGDGGD
jgi:hypothetical protein